LTGGGPGQDAAMHHETRIVKRADATNGPRGEKLMAHGDTVALRVWEREPEGETSPEHANDYEYVAYVAAGALRVRIGDDDAQEVRAGDSYVVPAGTSYSFDILEAATVVEAVSPASAVGGS
jgi:quercetin dioxygenase-like cupin family protein